MYTPNAFRVTEFDALSSFIEQYDFATIVSSPATGLVASHVPVILDRSQPVAVLRAHFARANEHWHAFDGSSEALIMFQGPHAYVSPSWYKTSPAVPTWNYAAVHVYGKPTIVEGAEPANALLRTLVAKYENHREKPWRMEDAGAEFIERLTAAIVTFEIPIDRIEGKFKLSQNRSDEDRRGTIRGLEGETDEGASSVAALMRAFETAG